MKIAIIGDIHANIHAFKLALKDIKKEKVDQVLFLGDYITDGEESNKIIKLVKKCADYAILGNREKYILNYDENKKDYNNYKPIDFVKNSLTKESMDYIKSLPNELLISINNIKILLIHGNGYQKKDDTIKDVYNKIITTHEEFDLCFYGHYHIYKDEMYKGKRFINPGSIGMSTDYPTYKYCIIDLNTLDVRLKQFSVAKTYKKLSKSYRKTKYYKANPIWANLALDTIKYGKDCFGEFLNLFDSKVSNKDLGAKEFNLLWDETFNEYKAKKDDTQ